MRSPIVSRSTHAEAIRTAATNARSQEAEKQRSGQQTAWRKANATQTLKLAARAAVLIDPLQVPGGTPPGDVTAARQRFREPIERVEGVAKHRFIGVANKVGLATKSARRHGEYFNFWPYYNVNITNPIPIVSTPVGEIAVELGASWTLNKSKYYHQLGSEAAYFARVIRTGPEADRPEEMGYVRLGRLFRGRDIEKRVFQYGVEPDVSGYQGRVILGSEVMIEDEYVDLVAREASPDKQANILSNIERAASAFAILTEFAADTAGVQNHLIDADAVWLALNAVQTEPRPSGH